MKNVVKNLIAGAILMAGANATASVIVLDFEGIGAGANINDFYNGGLDSFGNSGVDYGIAFQDAIACKDADAEGGGNCNSANEPSGETGMIFLDNNSAILSLASGFDTGLSFFYTSATAGTVSVYDEVGASGNLLGSVSFGVNFNTNCSGDPTGTFCNWDIASIAFSGIAKSIDFGGTANQVIYDDITFGSVDPGNNNNVSSPGSLALLGLGIFGVAASRRKFK
ncbi:MAG: PEP-CTERM sorting domain-containing protein [Glaciecola sp.]